MEEEDGKGHGQDGEISWARNRLLSLISDRCPEWDSKRTLPEYELRVLPLLPPALSSGNGSWILVSHGGDCQEYGLLVCNSKLFESVRRFGVEYHSHFRRISQARIQQKQMTSRAGFLLDLLFDPEGWGDTFFRNVALFELHGVNNPKAPLLYLSASWRVWMCSVALYEIKTFGENSKLH